MKKIIVNVYSFNDLSKEAKERAHRNYLKDTSEHCDAYLAIDSIKKGLERFFELELERYSIDCQFPKNSKFSFNLHNCDRKLVENLRRQDMLNWFIEKSYPLYKDILEFKEHYFTGTIFDLAFIKPIKNFIMRDHDYKTLLYLAEDCVWEVIFSYIDEYEHLTSIDYFAELCQEMNWYFNETGEMLPHLKIEHVIEPFQHA